MFILIITPNLRDIHNIGRTFFGKKETTKMRKVASLITTILITILCYSAIDYYNIEHGKTQQKQKKKQHKATKEERTTTVVMNTLRPWEQCETAQRYIFLKKHKVASR